MKKTMMTTDFDFPIDVRDVAIVEGVPRVCTTTKARENWIVRKIDSYYDRLDRMPDCETRRALLVHDDEGNLGRVFHQMAEIEWERRA